MLLIEQLKRGVFCRGICQQQLRLQTLKQHVAVGMVVSQALLICNSTAFTNAVAVLQIEASIMCNIYTCSITQQHDMHDQ